MFIYNVCSQNRLTHCHGRMARGGYELPKGSHGPAMPYPSTPCGRAARGSPQGGSPLVVFYLFGYATPHTPMLSVPPGGRNSEVASGAILVSSLSTPSPAEEDGNIQTEDQLLSVDNGSVEGATVNEVATLLKQKAQHQVAVTLLFLKGEDVTGPAATARSLTTSIRRNPSDLSFKSLDQNAYRWMALLGTH
jgi:hypothetical protein